MCGSRNAVGASSGQVGPSRRAHLLEAADVGVLVVGEVQARLLRADGRVAVHQYAPVVHQARRWQPAAARGQWGSEVIVERGRH